MDVDHHREDTVPAPKMRVRVRPIDVMVLLAMATPFVVRGWDRPARVDESTAGFAQQVDLSPLDRIAVQADGRLRSFESHAKTLIGYIAGPRRIQNQPHGFTYIDLMLRPERYRDVDIIYVKNKQVRWQIAAVLSDGGTVEAGRLDRIRQTGLISTALLDEPDVQSLLASLGQDLIRTAKAVNAIGNALYVADPGFLTDNLRAVAPPGDDVNKPWLSLAQVAGAVRSTRRRSSRRTGGISTSRWPR